MKVQIRKRINKKWYFSKCKVGGIVIYVVSPYFWSICIKRDLVKNPLKVLKYFFKYSLSRFIKTKLYDLRFWYKYKYLRSIVYYDYSVTDCDLVTVEGQGTSIDIEHYYEMVDNAVRNAEGSTYFNIIDESEYIDDSRYTRDRVMEAYEDGRGSSINI